MREGAIPSLGGNPEKKGFETCLSHVPLKLNVKPGLESQWPGHHSVSEALETQRGLMS